MATNRKKELGKRYAPGQSPIARADARMETFVPQDLIQEIMYMKDLKF